MKYTLLDMTQAIASSMDSDEINSISDSVESMQIATVIRTAYYDLITRLNLPEHSTLFNLTASGDNTQPTLMTVPSDVAKIVTVKYNKKLSTDTAVDFRDVTYMSIDDFLARMYRLDTDAPEVGTFTKLISGSSIEFLYVDNAAPHFYTSFDDRTVIFDSYDNTVDTTLTSSKTLCYGNKVIPWTMSDGFTPDLDEPQFPLLLNESKSLAWAELKQMPHQKAEQSAKRQWSVSQRTKKATDAMSDFKKLYNFGRK